MPGGGVCDENLEQRIERIRKRDEEIEKKHREAEADRLAALQANAMVKTTAPSDDEWPKAHKYDKLDFTYDVKNDNAESDEKKPTEEIRLQRPFKKFPEGQGPPADPTYNFLADAERDGKIQANNALSDSKNWRANNNNNNNSNTVGASNNSNRRNNANNNSFNRGRSGAKGKNPMQKGKNDEPILRKNDRERNNEPRLQRQKSSDGMWRRTDDKKTDSKEAKINVLNSPTGKKNDGAINSSNKPSIQQRIIPAKSDADNLQQKLSDLSIEKRGNITVSVTKDGEVKSVKLEAARVIGTGRVGGGALMRQPQSQQQQQQPFMSNTTPMMDTNLNANPPALINMNYPVIDQFKPPQSQLQAEPFIQTPIITPKQTVNGPPFKLPSVQDRLIKNRVFFDENLKNTAQTGKKYAGNQ